MMNTDKKFSSKGHDLSKIKKGSLHGEVTDEFELDIDYEGLQEYVPSSTEIEFVNSSLTIHNDLGHTGDISNGYQDFIDHIHFC